MISGMIIVQYAVLLICISSFCTLVQGFHPFGVKHGHSTVSLNQLQPAFLRTTRVYFKPKDEQHPGWKQTHQYEPVNDIEDEKLLELDAGDRYHLLLVNPDPNKRVNTINIMRQCFPDITYEEGKDIFDRAVSNGGCLVRVLTGLVSSFNSSSFLFLFLQVSCPYGIPFLIIRKIAEIHYIFSVILFPQ